jgi:hypothetical protein
MSFDVMVMLFIGFSVVSSLVKKFQERQRENQNELESRGMVRKTVSTPEPEVPEFDLSEWDDFPEPEPRERPFSSREFREVRGTRSVSELDTGREFREVRGLREILEADTGPEFRDPLADEVEITPKSYQSFENQKDVVDETQVSKRKKRRKSKLRFSRGALINAVLYKEILGTPRGEDMPW